MVFFGPSFLWSNDRDQLNNGEINPVSKEDSELKKVERVNFTMTNETNILRIGLLTTSWLKMKKIMAWVILVKKILTKQIKKPTSDN